MASQINYSDVIFHKKKNKVLGLSKQDLCESWGTFIELAGHARMLHETICTERCMDGLRISARLFSVFAYI